MNFDWVLCEVCNRVYVGDKHVCRTELEIPLDELSPEVEPALERSARAGDWRQVSVILMQRWKALKGAAK